MDSDYLAKYRSGIQQMGATPESFARIMGEDPSDADSRAGAIRHNPGVMSPNPE